MKIARAALLAVSLAGAAGLCVWAVRASASPAAARYVPLGYRWDFRRGAYTKVSAGGAVEVAKEPAEWIYGP